MKRNLCIVLSLVFALAGYTWGQDMAIASQEPEAGGDTPVIYTSFYPVKYFAERIGGDKVKVVCPVPATADPAFWMPNAKTIQAFQRADVIIINGASFEKWIRKVTLPPSRIIDTAKPLADELIKLEKTVTHSHGPGGVHTHGGIDGHTWLDPVNAKTQAAQIHKAFSKRFPAHAELFDKNYDALARDLGALDARLKGLRERMSDQRLVCSHPAYNYIGRRYGWQLKNLHLDPETMPDEATFAEIKVFLEKKPATYVLWESQPAKEIAAKMRKTLGLESLVFSPCEVLDADQIEHGEDFLSVMNRNVDRLEKAFGK